VSERLTEDELNYVERIMCSDDADTDALIDVGTLALRMTAELRARRAADLTAEEREALEWLRDIATITLEVDGVRTQAGRAYDALTRLLGATP
jgi:hypothetical protein